MTGYDYDLGIVGGGAAGLTRFLTSKAGPVNRLARQGIPFEPSRGAVFLREING